MAKTLRPFQNGMFFGQRQRHMSHEEENKPFFFPTMLMMGRWYHDVHLCDMTLNVDVGCQILTREVQMTQNGHFQLQLGNPVDTFSFYRHLTCAD